MSTDAFAFELFGFWAGVVLLIAFLPRLFFRNNTEASYVTLKRPPFAPPPAVFGIVWAILYGLQIVAVHIVRLRGGAWDADENRRALILFLVLQVMLTLWTVAFDLLKAYALAVLPILISLVVCIIVAVMFLEYSLVSALFMFVLAAWLAFAFVLAISIAVLNSAGRVAHAIESQASAASFDAHGTNKRRSSSKPRRSHRDK